MIVCLCRRVCDKTIRAAIDGGARTVADIGAACGAGTGCGGCAESIAEMIAAPDAERADALPCPRRGCSCRERQVPSPYLATVAVGDGT